MNHLSLIVKSHFKKRWKTIVCQVKAVNDIRNPKRGFLFDCEAARIEKLSQLVVELKQGNLVGDDIVLATVKDDVFILNTSKFITKQVFVVIDVSGRLKEPQVIDFSKQTVTFDTIDRQLTSQTCNQVVHLEVHDDWSLPTIFGYLIGYPILYYVQSNEETNNLGFVELTVIQIHHDNDLLFSFSVPKLIHDQDANVRMSLLTWLLPFRNDNNFEVKTFNATHSNVVL